jgi:hypothetical protein
MDNVEMIRKGKECDDVEWIPVTQDGVQWWVLVVAVWTVSYVNGCSMRLECQLVKDCAFWN